MADDHNAQLPACQKCRLRKVGCDRQAPKCSNCTKGHVACIVIDPVTGEQFSRHAIDELEKRERELKRMLGEDATATTTRSPHPVVSNATERTMANQGSNNGGFLGAGSGLEFLQSILSDPKWQHHRRYLVEQLASRPRLPRLQLVPSALPTQDNAEQLLENYFTRFHIHHTFLLSRHVIDVFNRFYSARQSSNPLPQDYFRLFMVLAISATTLYRARLSLEHPSSYYMAAETYLGHIPLIQGPDAIENLLLIARFGMYHHIGTSLWEISQLCMRQCIEWRLHSRPSKMVDPLTEQHHRRIFWECYVLDRYSSGILGRPTAILESEISVSLPLDADDETISNSHASSLSEIPAATAGSVTELSVFIFCIQLRRISSRVHSVFYTSCGRHLQRAQEFQSIGEVYVSFSRFHSELSTWRATAPVFASPRSLYERPEWHDFLYEKDRLLLARGAMSNVPSRPYSGDAATMEILTACYTSATRVIELYADLMSRGVITWTRSYFQVIFTAGLTVIYCVGLDVFKASATSALHYPGLLQTLALCSTILSFFKENMPDAGSFAVVFEVLKGECINDVIVDTDQHSSMVPPQTFDNSDPSLSNVGNIPFPSLSGNGNTDYQMHHSYSDMSQSSNQEPQDFSLGLTDDLMSQLEAGLGEYAWGSLNIDDHIWDQFPQS